MLWLDLIDIAYLIIGAFLGALIVSGIDSDEEDSDE